MCNHSLFKNPFVNKEKSVIEATQTMVTQRHWMKFWKKAKMCTLIQKPRKLTTKNNHRTNIDALWTTNTIQMLEK